MAAECNVSIICEVTGLGKNLNFCEKFAITTAPTKALYHYMEQATKNADEALELGDVATEGLLVIKCVSNDVYLDLDYDDATFDSDLTIKEGECAVIPLPAGTIRFEAVSAEELSTIEYLLVGT